MAFSSDHIYTTGTYLSNKPTWDDEGAPAKAEIINRILNANQIHPATVVEVGCGAGGILKTLSRLNTGIRELRGYDISPDAITLADKKKDSRLTFFNSDFANSAEPGGDVLLLIDVVEHIDDYYGFLGKMQGRSKYVVFHIPLDLSARNILKPHTMLLQRELVGHLHFFTKEIVEWALKDTGFTVIDWVYTKPVIDIEPAKSLKAFVKKTLRNISFALNKDLSAKLWGGYSMMILAK